MIKTLLFGGGNFQRAFAARLLQTINATGYSGGRAVVVRPTDRGYYDRLERQNWQYQLWIRGRHAGKTIDRLERIDCIERAVYPYEDFAAYRELARLPDLQTVISNTTEAGIRYVPEARPTNAPATEFPAKLTQLLYARWQHFDGDPNKGLDFLPCELIADNGLRLRQCVIHYALHWELEADFLEWLATACSFATSLVDSIVPGAPPPGQSLENPLLPNDQAIVTLEPYFLLVVQNASERLRRQWDVPGHDLPVIWTDDLTPYRDLKVRLLNGAHTAMVPVGITNGIETVREFTEHPRFGPWLRDLLQKDLSPTLAETVPPAEREAYVAAVLDRFANPFVDHRLESILLNSLSKWPARLGPSVGYYQQTEQTIPERIRAAWAAQTELVNQRKHDLPDDPERIDTFLSRQPSLTEWLSDPA